LPGGRAVTARRVPFRILLARVFAVVVAFAPIGALADQRLALVIGNADYPDLSSPLNVALKGARAVTEQLQNAGFEVDAIENATKESLQQALQGFYEKIEPGAIVVFFYGGYAIQVARQNFVIPVDAQIWTESDVRRDGASIEAILAAIRHRGAGTRVLVLDASRRNPFERRFRSYSAGLGPIETPANTIVISAASPGKVIGDTDPDNSLFVDELMKQTNTPRVPMADIFNRTREEVSRATNGEQVPWVSINLPNRLYLRRPIPLLPRRASEAERRHPPG
jgi:uncharacterized caspase-like protein